jgi:glycosyltransferase involved in cell wall biosynthesis
MQSGELPRVLVLAANPFTRRHNNSLTFSSLFEGWPRDRLAQIYVPFVTPIAPEFDVCERFWAVTPLGLRSGAGAPVAAPAAPSRSMSRARRALMRLADQPFARRLAYPLREVWYSRRSLFGGPVMREIERFAPNVIFTSLGSLSMINMARHLSRVLSAPLVPYFTDDWISTEYRTSFGSAVLRRELQSGFDAILASAPVRMVISSRMAEEYTRRYGGGFLPFVRCVDGDSFAYEPPPSNAERPVQFVYAGQVGLDRWKGLRAIAEALRSIDADGARAQMTVYTTPQHAELYREQLTLAPVMRLAGHVENDRLPAIYASADVLVHTESFAPDLAEYTRYSFSTKLAEYMMAGRPLFGFGPPDVGSMHHIRASGCGVVVGSDDSHALREGLSRLIDEKETRMQLGARARAVALEDFEGVNQRHRFAAALRTAAGNAR